MSLFPFLINKKNRIKLSRISCENCETLQVIEIINYCACFQPKRKFNLKNFRKFKNIENICRYWLKNSLKRKTFWNRRFYVERQLKYISLWQKYLDNINIQKHENFQVMLLAIWHKQNFDYCYLTNFFAVFRMVQFKFFQI